MLLARIQSGDGSAFIEAYDLFAPKLYRHALFRTSSPEVAEDIASETFTRAWEVIREKAKEIRRFADRMVTLGKTGTLAARRRAFGEELVQALDGAAEVYGLHARERHHWVFALGCDEPQQLVRALRAIGFDATARSSLVPVLPTGGGEAPAANTNTRR
mgnify:CR=1 FL=1